jgi:hypothetical protein
LDRDQYCRDVEAYLCRKNDGHLIRIVGPAFELVSGWAARGIPPKVVRRGVDRYFERYYAKGPRRRPVRIDFCETDVLEAFDEWRRAVGVLWPRSVRHGQPNGQPAAPAAKPRCSLVAHIDRVIGCLVARQTDPRMPSLDAEISRTIEQLESLRQNAATARGAARVLLLEQLAGMDGALASAARASCAIELRTAMVQEAAKDLEPFRERMELAVYQRAIDAATDRSLRETFNLPTISYG